MQLIRTLPLVALALFTAAGCSSAPSMVGKWSVASEKAPAGTKITMDFTSDKFTQTLDMNQMGTPIHLDISGTYTFDGKKLKMTSTDIKLDDSKIPAAFRDAAKKQIEGEKGKTEEIDVKLEGDKATFTQKSGTATLTRIK